MCLSIDQVWWVNKLWLKRYIQKCTLSHVLILILTFTGLVNHGKVKNKNLKISWMEHYFFYETKQFLTCASYGTF